MISRGVSNRLRSGQARMGLDPGDCMVPVTADFVEYTTSLLDKKLIAAGFDGVDLPKQADTIALRGHSNCGAGKRSRRRCRQHFDHFLTCGSEYSRLSLISRSGFLGEYLCTVKVPVKVL